MWKYVSVVALTSLVVGSNLLAVSKVPPSPGSLPIQEKLPDPLKMQDGQKITTEKDWFEKRRPELKDLFQLYMYGYLPPCPNDLKFTVERENTNYFGGKASKREVTISFGGTNAPAIHLLVVVPNKRTAPAPVFVGINFCGNHALVTNTDVAIPTSWMRDKCPGVENHAATENGRGTQVDVWALEQTIDRGYAVATFCYNDVEPDDPAATDGLRAYYKPQHYRFGAIAAWAWGVHRAVDYLVTAKDIDSNRIGVVGHSRNGKASLVAAAFDERISLCIPLQAGCGGTAPSRGKVGESVKQINDHFPHWFKTEFKDFNEQPERLPFDQHCLIALVAPRSVLLPNATEDTWANPAGQFEMLQAAEPVYKLLHAGSLDAKQMPEVGKLVSSKLGYYIRPGKHSMTKDDWKVFLDYADVQWGVATKPHVQVERHLRLSPTPGNPRNSEGDFVRLKDGSILFIYTHFTGGSADHAQAFLASRKSTDEGKSWSDKDEIVVANEGAMNVMSVSLLRLNSGEIALFYLRKNSNGDCRPVMRISTDEAKTWSAPHECLSDEQGYFVLNNSRVIQLQSGRLVMPLAQHAAADGKRHPGKIVCLLSDDNGRKWRHAENVLEKSDTGEVIDFMEPGVAELGSNHIVMVIRTRVGCQYFSRSEDGGEHWSAPKATNILSPESPATIRTIPGTKNLLMLWNDLSDQPESVRRARPPKRTPLSAAISRDEGVTWENAKVLEDDPAAGYCYTAVMFVGDRVLLSYCAHKSPWGLESTQISSFSLQDLSVK